MRKNLGPFTYLYPLPVLIIGTYDENGNLIMYKELINDADILFTTILATSKFNKKNKQSYNSSFNRILKNKNIFDELVVINSDYKYDFCHYNEVIAGIKSTLDAL